MLTLWAEYAAKGTVRIDVISGCVNCTASVAEKGNNTVNEALVQ
jgi:hypothetical protein